ncbi:MAG: DUF4116 domain-containing protein [Desulfobacterales bacterium]|nr:DUF4116 domain-containing protein [Desulfobacterales bacterium]
MITEENVITLEELVEKNSDALKNVSKDFVFRSVSRNFEALKYIPDDFYLFESLVVQATKRNWQAFQYAKSLRSDEKFVLNIIRYNWQAIQYSSEKLLSDKTFMHKAIKVNLETLKYASDELTGNKDFIQKAVSRVDGRAILYASDFLQNDREFVLKAVIANEKVFKYSRFKSDKDFILQLIGYDQCWNAFQYTDQNLLEDKAFVMKCVKKRGLCLQFLSEQFRANREIVMIAVENNGLALQFTADHLKADKQVVITAVQNRGYALEYASIELRFDREIVIKAVGEMKLSILEWTKLIEQEWMIIAPDLNNAPVTNWFISNLIKYYNYNDKSVLDFSTEIRYVALRVLFHRTLLSNNQLDSWKIFIYNKINEMLLLDEKEIDPIFDSSISKLSINLREITNFYIEKTNITDILIKIASQEDEQYEKIVFQAFNLMKHLRIQTPNALEVYKKLQKRDWVNPDFYRRAHLWYSYLSTTG